MPDFEDFRPNNNHKPDTLIRNAVIGAGVLVVAIFAVMLFVTGSEKEETPQAVEATPAVEEATTPEPTPEPTPTPTPTPEPTPQGPPNYVEEGKLHAVAFHVVGNLTNSLKQALPVEQKKYASALAEQLAAILSWKIDPRRDMRKGDKVKIVYNPQAKTMHSPIYGFSYQSQRLKKTLFFVYFPSDSSATVSYFDREGRGIIDRIMRPPFSEDTIAKATIRPGGKKGLTFFVPPDSAVVMPYPARTLRLNWDVDNLGRSVEVRYLDSGVIAQFCHLTTISDQVKEGGIIGSGTKFARVGNTGGNARVRFVYRTFRAGDDGVNEPIDPIEHHGREPYQLAAADRASFLVATAKVEKIFSKITARQLSQHQD